MSEHNFEDLIGLINVDSLKAAAKQHRMRSGEGCFTCNYTGYIYNHEGKACMCECTKQKIFKELYSKANIPLAFLNNTVDDWNTRCDSNGQDLGPQQSLSENIYNLLKFYDRNLKKICQGEPKILTHTGNIRTPLHTILFEGNIGSGKTFIASVLVQSAIRKGLSAKYYDWSDLIQTMSDFDKKSEMDSINEEFKTYDFIAIDGVEIYQYMPNQMIPQLDRLCKSRLNSGKPSVIMSLGNLSSFNAGSGWSSLIKSCLQIRLPQLLR